MNFSEISTDVLPRIFSYLNQDMQQLIANLLPLRLVCKQWYAVLTDQQLASLVGVSGINISNPSDEDRQNIEAELWSAIDQAQPQKLELLCKLFSPFIPTLTTVPFYCRGVTDSEISFDRFFPQAISILLRYGLPPSVSVTWVYPSKKKQISPESLLANVIYFKRNKGAVCFDFLIKKDDINAQDRSRSLSRAALSFNLYAICRLLCFAHRKTEINKVCGIICEHHGPCCQAHLRPVVIALIHRGADQQWQGWIQRHPSVCSLPADEQLLLTDYITRALANSADHSTVFQDTLSWGCALCLCYLLYRSVLCNDCQEEDDQDEEGIDDATSTVAPPAAADPESVPITSV